MRGRITPKWITKLSNCEIFVFGSNLAGQHGGGAARMAHDHFGAEWGVGVGPTGQCYAIPTMHGGIKKIKPYVDEFIQYAKEHPNNRFLLTRIGCGIAGFTDEEIAPLFDDATSLPNVTFPEEWIPELTEDETKKMFINVPKAINEEDLIRLSEEYKYIIGTRTCPLVKLESKINIRYVIDQDCFGYASFGDFFFLPDGELYIWSRDKKFADKHDQDVVERFFHDECYDRGYCFRSIFAGVQTPYKDSDGKNIYTGDVIELELAEYNGEKHTFALGTLGYNSQEEKRNGAYYAFALDNHCITPEMCRKMTRKGTVFYQLDWNEPSVTIAQRCQGFQPSHYDSISEKDKMVMCRYTPNFDQKIWKYHANDILGIEFNDK